MKYKVEYACYTGRGKLRAQNQDNIWTCGVSLPEKHNEYTDPKSTVSAEGCPMFFVFDGMGGEEHGETASFICAKTVDAVLADPSGEAARETDADAFLRALCMQMNADVTKYADAKGLDTVGSTLAGVLFAPDRVTVCNVGDSRVYLFRDGELSLCSKDHALLSSDGQKTSLLQYIGVREEDFLISPHLAHAAPCPGDIYLLCSDGLTDMVPEDRIRTLISMCPTAFGAAALLYYSALENGGKDNVTVTVCCIL